MIRQLVKDGARVTRALAACGACVVLVRFSLDVYAWSTKRAQDADSAAHVHASSAKAGRRGQGERDDALAEASAAASVRPAPSALTSPKPKRRTLFVDLGPPRSQVYVNGVAVGHTPYAGTWGCRDGDEVSIVVMWPGTAPPIHAMAHCGPQIVADNSLQNQKLDKAAVEKLLNDENTGSALKQALKNRAAQ